MEQPVDKTISYGLVISPAAMGLDQALRLEAAEGLRGTSGPSDGGELRDRAKQGPPSRNRTRKQKGRLAAPFSSSGVRRSGGFGNHDHLHRGFDVGVQMHDDFEFAGGAEGAFAQHNLGLLDRRAGLGQRVGDRKRTRLNSSP